MRINVYKFLQGSQLKSIHGNTRQRKNMYKDWQLRVASWCTYTGWLTRWQLQIPSGCSKMTILTCHRHVYYVSACSTTWTTLRGAHGVGVGQGGVGVEGGVGSDRGKWKDLFLPLGLIVYTTGHSASDLLLLFDRDTYWIYITCLCEYYTVLASSGTGPG